MMTGVAGRVRQASTGVRVTGGSVHSVPVDFLKMMMDQGAGEYLDALAGVPIYKERRNAGRGVAVSKTVYPGTIAGD